MSHAGAVEHLPLRTRNRALVADGQRDQHAEIGCIGHRREKAAADHIARPLHHVARLHHKSIETQRLATTHDAAGRPDIALKQPGFVIEAVRIGVSMRAFKPHGKAPALAWTYRLRHIPLTSLIQIIPAAIPRQHDVTRNPFSRSSAHANPCGLHRLDIEGKALPALKALWQGGDDAGNFHVARFPR